MKADVMEHIDTDAAAEADDPLRRRLEERYNKQRAEQAMVRREQIDRASAEQHTKLSQLPPSVSLASDELTMQMQELEGLCARHNLQEGVALVHQVRDNVNRELRAALFYLEQGYTSAFHGVMEEVRQQLQPSTNVRDEKNGSGTMTRGRHEDDTMTTVDASGLTSPTAGCTGQVDPKLLQRCPKEWRTHMKMQVIEEMKYQGGAMPTSVSRRGLSLRESLSATTGFFAESLATLLTCEVVRIYLYDDYHNLHCCATYPYHATQGDPMRGTYTEIMLAKELHGIVCGKGIAVNGGEAQYPLLGPRDVQLIKEEMEANGWASMRSCLIFPIISHKGANRALGMIHAANKIAVGASDRADSFTPTDEVTASVCARVLGCILSRYPVHYFNLRVGEAVHRAIFPRADTAVLDDHLPIKIEDDVEDAATVGNRALTLPSPMMIYRGPISDVYHTRVHRARKKKLGNLVLNDNTLSSVEFNLSSINESWAKGMEENVVMHKECRALNEQLGASRLLLRNLLDGLAAARGMRDAAEMAVYLQRLELLGRSESTEAIVDFVSNTLIERGRNPDRAVQDGNSPNEPTDGGAMQRLPDLRSASVGATSATSAASTTAPAVHSAGAASAALPSNTDTPVTGSAFLTSAQCEAVLRHQQTLNKMTISKMHLDGPECIRTYSCDPAKKRAQVRFIKDMLQRAQTEEDEAAKRRKAAMSGGATTSPQCRQPASALLTRPPRSPASSSSMPAAVTVTGHLAARQQHGLLPTSSTALAATSTERLTGRTCAKSDFANRRPFQLTQ